MEKLRTEPVRLCLLVLKWPSQPWWKALWELSECHRVIPSEKTLYIPGKGLPFMPSPPWDTVLFKINTLEQHQEGKRNTTPRGLGVERWVWNDFKGRGLEVLKMNSLNPDHREAAVRLALGFDLFHVQKEQGHPALADLDRPKVTARTVEIKRSSQTGAPGDSKQMKFRLKVKGGHV